MSIGELFVISVCITTVIYAGIMVIQKIYHDDGKEALRQSRRRHTREEMERDLESFLERYEKLEKYARADDSDLLKECNKLCTQICILLTKRGYSPVTGKATDGTNSITDGCSYDSVLMMVRHKRPVPVYILAPGVRAEERNCRRLQDTIHQCGATHGILVSLKACSETFKEEMLERKIIVLCPEDLMGLRG